MFAVHGTELVLCVVAEAIVVPATLAAIVAYVRIVLHPDDTE
jgi:hypothetical protein